MSFSFNSARLYLNTLTNEFSNETPRTLLVVYQIQHIEHLIHRSYQALFQIKKSVIC